MVEIKYNIKKRAPWVMLVSVAVILVLITGLVYWQFIRGAELKSGAIQQQTLDSVVSPKRGIIYDRNGKVLSQSISVQTVTASPSEVKQSDDIDEIADTLARILGEDEDEIRKIITRDSSYEIVARKISNKKALGQTNAFSYWIKNTSIPIPNPSANLWIANSEIFLCPLSTSEI